MFCTKCGTQLTSPNANFCTKCGAAAAFRPQQNAASRQNQANAAQFVGTIHSVVTNPGVRNAARSLGSSLKALGRSFDLD